MKTTNKSVAKGKKLLEGKRIVITRPEDQALELKEEIEVLGGEVLTIPLIEVKPSVDPFVLEEVLKEIGSYEWIIFTSGNGVRYFFEYFFKIHKDIRCIGGMRIACIGKGTADVVEKFHLQVDFIPDESVAERLAEQLIEKESLDNIKVLVITGNKNRDILPKKLEEEGHAIVDTLRVYETVDTDLSKSFAVKYFK